MRADIHSSGARIFDACLKFIAILTCVMTMACVIAIDDNQQFNKCPVNSGDFRRHKTESRSPRLLKPSMIDRGGNFRELLIVIKLQIWMHLLNRFVNLPQLRCIHILTDTATTESDPFVFNPPAKVDSHLQLSLFVTRESQ